MLLLFLLILIFIKYRNLTKKYRFVPYVPETIEINGQKVNEIKIHESNNLSSEKTKDI